MWELRLCRNMFNSANICSSFADISVPICLEKPLDLMSLLKLLEIDALLDLSLSKEVVC